MLNFLLTTTPTNQNSLLTMLPTIGIFAVVIIAFYFLSIRPQKKRDQEVTDMRDNLSIGDEITSTGGIVGRIISVQGETVLIETSGERTKIRLLKSSIARIDVFADGTTPEDREAQKREEKKNKNK